MRLTKGSPRLVAKREHSIRHNHPPPMRAKTIAGLGAQVSIATRVACQACGDAAAGSDGSIVAITCGCSCCWCSQRGVAVDHATVATLVASAPR
eukprot:15466380-Alexandrium_andersonii.AAC.1